MRDRAICLRSSRLGGVGPVEVVEQQQHRGRRRRPPPAPPRSPRTAGSARARRRRGPRARRRLVRRARGTRRSSGPRRGRTPRGRRGAGGPPRRSPGRAAASPRRSARRSPGRPRRGCGRRSARPAASCRPGVAAQQDDLALLARRRPTPRRARSSSALRPTKAGPSSMSSAPGRRGVRRSGPARSVRGPGPGRLGQLAGEQRGLEPGQRGRRLEADLLGQHVAQLLVGPQRLGLPTAAVQRDHPVGPQALPEGVRRAQALELADELGVAPGVEVGADPRLQRGEAGLLEADRLGPGEVEVGQIAEGRAPPEVEGGAEAVGGGGCGARRRARRGTGRPARRSGRRRPRRRPTGAARSPPGPVRIRGSSSASASRRRSRATRTRSDPRASAGPSSPHTSPMSRSGSIGRPGSSSRRSRIARSRRAVMPRVRSPSSTSTGPRRRNCMSGLPPCPKSAPSWHSLGRRDRVV